MFSFHHVALSVSDIDKSKKFYYALGFKTVLDWVSDNQDLTISHLILDSIFLELFCYKEFNTKNERSLEHDLKEIGVKHFGLKVDSIVAARERVISVGIAKEQDIQIKPGRTGITYFFLKDPDNNFVEIVEDKRDFRSKP
jgi:glyoxylase I family protein